jgi:hypothetical protein
MNDIIQNPRTPCEIHFLTEVQINTSIAARRVLSWQNFEMSWFPNLVGGGCLNLWRTSGSPTVPPATQLRNRAKTGGACAVVQRLERRKIVSPPGRCRLRQSCILPISTDVTGRATSSLHPESSFKRLPIDLPSLKKLNNPLINLLPPFTRRSSQLQPPQWSSLISCEFVAQNIRDSRSYLGHSCLIANLCLQPHCQLGHRGHHPPRRCGSHLLVQPVCHKPLDLESKSSTSTPEPPTRGSSSIYTSTDNLHRQSIVIAVYMIIFGLAIALLGKAHPCRLSTDVDILTRTRVPDSPSGVPLRLVPFLLHWSWIL